ncbi:hypothetical protein FGO68_gene3843 [Halteria grandinella]|uniref:Uncharacterized protein n=1 Tax=Halteria grandinella TaxID=5974 RepID=A0A8J8P2Q4_HALGN|nr:hypothetical protein FGO68_gene3843 [Halteria grandinella]
MKQEGRIDKKKKRASRKNKMLIAELEAAIRTNQFKRPATNASAVLETAQNYWAALDSQQTISRVGGFPQSNYAENPQSSNQHALQNHQSQINQAKLMSKDSSKVFTASPSSNFTFSKDISSLDNKTSTICGGFADKYLPPNYNGALRTDSITCSSQAGSTLELNQRQTFDSRLQKKDTILPKLPMNLKRNSVSEEFSGAQSNGSSFGLPFGAKAPENLPSAAKAMQTTEELIENALALFNNQQRLISQQPVTPLNQGILNNQGTSSDFFANFAGKSKDDCPQAATGYQRNQNMLPLPREVPLLSSDQISQRAQLFDRGNKQTQSSSAFSNALSEFMSGAARQCLDQSLGKSSQESFPSLKTQRIEDLKNQVSLEDGTKNETNNFTTKQQKGLNYSALLTPGFYSNNSTEEGSRLNKKARNLSLFDPQYILNAAACESSHDYSTDVCLRVGVHASQKIVRQDLLFNALIQYSINGNASSSEDLVSDQTQINQQLNNSGEAYPNGIAADFQNFIQGRLQFGANQ